MSLSTQLRALGLNQSEITVYLYLLENGVCTPPQIAQGTKIARTNCYNVLSELKNKELIKEQVRGKRKGYMPRDPSALLQSLERKKDLVQEILPDLRSLYTVQKNKPKIKFYEGVEEIKEIYWESLQSKQILAIGSTNQIELLVPGFLEKYFLEIKKRGIIFHDIVSVSSKLVAKDSQAFLKVFYDVRFLPKNFQDMPTDILLWEDNIALITLQEPVFGTVLTNTLLARTFENLFFLIKNNCSLS